MSLTAAIDIAVLCAEIIRSVIDIIREAMKPGQKMTDEEVIAKAEELRKTLKDAIDARVGDWLAEAKAPADAKFNEPKE